MTDIEIVSTINSLGEKHYHGSVVDYWFKFLGVRWFSIHRNLHCNGMHEVLTDTKKATGFGNKQAVIDHINRLLDEEVLDKKRSKFSHTQKEIIPKKK